MAHTLDDKDNLAFQKDADALYSRRVTGSVTIAEGMLSGVSYDYVLRETDGPNETYTFKSGGSSGTLVAMVVITYTDSTFKTMVSVTRS
jgi:hypothetical protein